MLPYKRGGGLISCVSCGCVDWTWTTVPFEDGSKFQGQYGIADGYGEMVWPSGDTYKGYWTKEGTMDGNGMYTFADGSRYIGQFRANRRDGIGTFTWAEDQSMYTGEWRDDMPHGRGQVLYPNGEVMDGTYQMGEIRYESIKSLDTNQGTLPVVPPPPPGAGNPGTGNMQSQTVLPSLPAPPAGTMSLPPPPGARPPPPAQGMLPAPPGSMPGSVPPPPPQGMR